MSDSILVIEDDNNLRLTLCDCLEMDGYEVVGAEDLKSAREVYQSGQYDLVVLDLMLPDGDGYEFARWLRQNQDDVIVLMLTARELERDVVEGFEVGADDYVTKPYRSAELMSRIKALLRRKSRSYRQKSSTKINGCQVDWLARTVYRHDEPIHITEKAFSILEFLYSHLGVAQSRDAILNAVWGEHVIIDERTIDNFVSQLKKQLILQQGQEYWIRSVRGVGYCLMRQG
ncbi:response regulator transcription factor [Pleionea sp. CnH1-48]|uniref:response regulator transcription factor n=1 Tax=Pleionea sp. CnH1-48 TaxID=2954494 RepID=UPI0020976C29|nr:response regulator transcription factor [Pleionea sp. CnH1-48]MCO7223201.1 response regulator transcription factor [Pleionea sp. CnH1-48]